LDDFALSQGGFSTMQHDFKDSPVKAHTHMGQGPVLVGSTAVKARPRLDQRPGLIKNTTVKLKLVLILLTLTLLPIFLIGYLSYNSFRTTLTQKIVKASLDRLSQTVVNIQLKLNEFENISVRLFINQEFNTTIKSYLSDKDPKTTLQGKTEISAYFNEYMISNQDIFAFMFICDRDLERSVIVTKDYYQDFLDLSRHFKETTTYRNILKAGGGIVWSSSIKLNLNHYLVLGRQIKNSLDGESLGILAIIIDEEKIDRLTNLNVYKQLNFSLGQIDNYGFIINNSGEIVSTPFKEEIGKNLVDIMKNNAPIKAILTDPVSDRDYGSEINQGSLITEVNRKQTLVTYKTIGSKIGVGGKSGWRLLSITPTSDLYAEVRSIGLSTLLIGVIFGILAIILGLKLERLLQTRK
jgi:two-component system sensor histidine kinase YesM